jgi:surfeit locus 1 family protein
MTFKPYPGLTIACALVFALLCGLGTWQLERLQWKLALIAKVNANMAASPLTLDQLLAMTPDEAQYRKVILHGHFGSAPEAFVFATNNGAPDYHELKSFITNDGHVLMVDRGLVPWADRGPVPPPPALRPILVKGQLTGVWRTPDPPGTFTPKPNLAHRIWYARDVVGIAAVDHLHLAAPVVIEADATPNPGGWPKGGQTVVNFRNQHLSYAVTWFGLAICLLGVWFAYNFSRGRIRFK